MPESCKYCNRPIRPARLYSGGGPASMIWLGSDMCSEFQCPVRNPLYCEPNEPYVETGES